MKLPLNDKEQKDCELLSSYDYDTLENEVSELFKDCSFYNNCSKCPYPRDYENYPCKFVLATEILEIRRRAEE